MGKINKNKRIGVVTKILTENPNQVFTLNHFTEQLECAKSTLSEDIDVVEEFFEEYHLGKIDSLAGASGGVVYRPIMSKEQVKKTAEEICLKIKEESRIIPGGYVYMNDILYDPGMAYGIGRALAQPFIYKEVDYVVTIETKGIPIAMMVARALNVPMVVVRKSARLTEGTTIQMNYITGSSRTIKTMSLAKRAINRNAKVLFIDDFMKAGGTAKGIIDLMHEFEAEVVGVGVVMTTKTPQEKLIEQYYSLVALDTIEETMKEIIVHPSC